MALSSINVSNTSSYEVNNTLFSINLYSTENSSEQEEVDLKNNHSTINISDCVDRIRKKYNLSYNLLMARVEYTETLNNASISIDPRKNEIVSAARSLNFHLLDTYTNVVYNITTECDNESILVKIPFPKNTKINIFQARKFQLKNINILNEIDPFYINRCFTYFDETNRMIELTLGERKAIYYKNQIVLCSPGCIFKGFDKNYFIICDCKNVTNIAANVLSVTSNSLSSLNYDIALCINVFFNVK